MSNFFGLRRILGFPLGILLFVCVYLAPTPEGLSLDAKKAAAVAFLMAVWWMTECLPIAVTALVPLALYPLLSIMSASETATRYADPNIFLFMGGFMLALAMQKWNLHKRIALNVIYAVGAGPRRMLAGFTVAAAVISMFVSNTATAVMMLPIGMAVVSHLDPESGTKSRFGVALMLAIAYACSVGGAATLIGSPPNLIFAGQAKMLFPELGEVNFVQWFLFAFPLAVGFLVMVWAYLAFAVLGKTQNLKSDKALIEQEIQSLGPWSRGEIGVMIVFALAVLGWIWRADISFGGFTIPGWTTLFHLKGVHDGTVAMTAALVLFAAPVSLKKGEFLLDWETASKLPWGILLLFGGGFALAESFRITGLDIWLGGGFEVLRDIPRPALILILCLAITFLSELMSNTAQVTMLMPVLAAAAPVLGEHPYILMIPATIAASFSFMMPVGTPPNAVIFGSGYVTIPKMAKAGFALNIMGAFWITLISILWLETSFGIKTGLS